MPEIESSGTPEPQNAETKLESQPSTPPATGATDRFGEDAGFLAGKSQAEAVAWVNNLVTEVQQLVATKQPAASPQPQRQIVQDAKLPDPDMALTDPAGYQRQLADYFTAQQQGTLAQAAVPVYAQLATMAREMSKNDSANKDVWSKWGAEVEQMVGNVPQHLRTKELYDQAAVMVRGRHVDEIATEKAAALAGAGTGLARAGGGSDVDTDDGDTDVWAKIEASPIGKAALNVAGKKGILAAIRNGAYKDLNDYATQASKSRAKVDPANPNIVRDYSRK